MATLHMETEKVQSVARKLDTTGSTMLTSLHQIQFAASRLNYAWRGGEADDFNHDLNNLIKKLEHQVTNLQNLSVRVAREADEWLAADQFGRNGSRPGSKSPNIKKPESGPSSWWDQFRKGQKFVVGIAITVIDGVHSLYGVAADQFNRQVDLGKEAVQKAVQASDDFIDDGFTNLLGNPRDGASEAIKLQVKGDVSIPGIEVGVPGSFKVEGAKEVTLIKEDGKYKLVLSNGGGVGIEEPLLPGGEGSVKFGDKKYGVDVDASAEAMAKGEVEVTYEFDPRKPGDMTKMAAFLYGIGVMDSPAGPLVAPTLHNLKDNIVGIKVETGMEGSFEADASALVKVAGVKSEIGASVGGELQRVNGGWESIQQAEFKAGSKISILTNEIGADINTRYETITHADGSQSVKVIVDMKSEGGNELKFDKISENLPELDGLKSLKGSNEKYEAIKMEFTLDKPLETVKEMIETSESGINWQALNDNSNVVISTRTGSEAGIGASGSLQLPTQKIGVGGEANIIRESSREVYRSR